jgi:CTP:molybdopterin cytidylyltransferase MocA
MGAVARAAVILAGGASERMGTPKALLPWSSMTLLDYAVQQARAAHVDLIVLVLGPATQHLAHQFGPVIVSVNPDPRTGRSASICLGTAALPDEVEAVLIQSVDQPVVAPILAALFEALKSGSGDVAVPTYQGRRGHPVCFAGKLLSELRQVNEAEQGLRAVVRRHSGRLLEVPVNTDSVLWNLNDPATYAAARPVDQP